LFRIASLAGQRGGGGLGSIHYSASKAGVLGLTKALARELTPKGIRVSCITPELIEMEMMRGLPPERKAAAIKETLVGWVGTPQDIANGILFLASDESSYLTGLVLDINGGLILH
jgi:NAD(P)-dependent dehydrogenase (short-subunit alcohol dehydrogenase family)